MKIEIQKVGHMVADGAQILNVIQNKATPLLDLLVRESIQNSLDAGRPNEDVFVDFTIKKFDNDNLIKNFQRLKFKEKTNEMLIISDKNTEGLTGSFSYNDSKIGNLLKLVYNVGKPQEQEGAGGSWGYGKTIYYRLGKGLVIYYSRIKSGEGFEERLVASLVENQKGETIIDYNEDENTGIAWWGDIKNGRSAPVVDSLKISEVLSSIDVERYKDEETGTRIIIPHVDTKSLFEQVKSNIEAGQDNGYDENGTTKKESIFDDFEQYLSNAIQKWYAPRVNNKNYIYGNKSNLLISINGIQMLENEQFQLYKIIKTMYNHAYSNQEENFKTIAPSSTFYKREIKLRVNNKMKKIGDFVYGNIHYSDLGMIDRNSRLNPYNFLDYNVKYKGDSMANEPIMIYTRQPGMIINYNNDSSWSINNYEEDDKEKYLVGFFILNSNNDEYIEAYKKNITFEEYFRLGEKADHFRWEDQSIQLEYDKHHNFSFITKINNQINNEIKGKYSKEEKTTKTSVTEAIGNLFGNEIMPIMGFGKGVKAKKERAPRKSSRTKKALYIANVIYEETEYISNREISIPFSIRPYEDIDLTFDFLLSIDSDSKVYTISEFEKRTTLPSPLEMNSIIFQKEYGSKLVGSHTSKLHKKITGLRYKISLKSNEMLYGKISIVYDDKMYSPTIKISEVIDHE